jgi:hypothetical protein
VCVCVRVECFEVYGILVSWYLGLVLVSAKRDTWKRERLIGSDWV